MTVPPIDLRAGFVELEAEIMQAVARVCASGKYVLGPEVKAFEREFARFCGVRHCVGVGNGTDALALILRACDIGPGDDVIVPAYTAVATWMAVSMIGATPVGVDVCEDTYNLDPAALDPARTLAALPPLIKGYLRLGGFVGDGAVIDQQFNTTDVCIVVKTDLVAEKYSRHYERQSKETWAA